MPLKKQQLLRSWRRNWIVMVAILVHGVWGLMLFFSDAPLSCTPMADSPFRRNQHLAGTVYLMAALAAIIPWFWPKVDLTVWGLFCCLPQQCLLMMSAGTAIKCVLRGTYADGVPRPWPFIAADQLWVIVGMFAHTASLVDWFWFSRKGVSL